MEQIKTGWRKLENLNNAMSSGHLETMAKTFKANKDLFPGTNMYQFKDSINTARNKMVPQVKPILNEEEAKRGYNFNERWNNL